MKKFFLFTMIMGAMLLASCAKGSKQSNDASAELVYLSSDLRLRDLYGNVEQVTFNYDTEMFDENGQIITQGMNIKRDAEGRVIKYTLDKSLADGDLWIDDEYKYDELGNVSEATMERYAGTSVSKCYYDEAGHLAKTTTECSGEGDEWTETVVYSILEIDDHGNWIKRNAHVDYGDLGLPAEDRVETRDIKYRN